MIIEKAGLILTLQLETGRVIVVDQVTGDLLFETDFFDDEDAVVIDEEDGTVTIFDPDTEEEPAEIDDDLPDIMWGRRVAEPVMWPQIANSDTIQTSRPDNAVPKS